MPTSALLIAALFTAGCTLLLLVADAVTGSIAARSVRDDDDLDHLTRSRTRDLVWSVAVTAALAVLVAFTVDSVLRAAIDLPEDDEPARLWMTLGLLAVTGLATFGVGLLGAIAAVRRERPSYGRMRRDLRDRTAPAMEPEEVATMEGRLARADRARVRRLGASTVLRMLGLLVVLLVSVVVIVPAVTAGLVGWVSAAALADSLALVAVLVGARAAAVRTAAVDAVLDAQRAEVVALLERAKIPQRAPVPGLRDRVTRALAILREQQR